MQRFLISFIALLFLLLTGEQLCAQAQWPSYPHQDSDPYAIARGAGYYFSIVKIVMILILFWFWVRVTDWASQDCQLVGMSYALWTPILVFPFLFGVIFFALTVPIFIVGYFLLLLTLLGPIGAYVWKRNGMVPDYQKVLTKDHLRFLMASTVGKFGIKMDVEKKAPHEMGPPVQLQAVGGSDSENQANMIVARQSPAYIFVKEVIADGLLKNCDRILLDLGAQAFATRYQIDGVWHDAPPREREEGQMIMAVIKKLAGLEIQQLKRAAGRESDCRI